MFGHQDDSQQPQNAPWVTDVSPVTAPAADQPPTPAPEAPAPAATPPFTPAGDTPAAGDSPALPAPAGDDAAVQSPADDSTDSLLSIKQQALQQLSPLVGQLEQSPEEKFRTTMMMIQAADDRTLVSAAYEAAKQIPDEKIRAQALLDIVNEINYFTQH